MGKGSQAWFLRHRALFKEDFTVWQGKKMNPMILNVCTEEPQGQAIDLIWSLYHKQLKRAAIQQQLLAANLHLTMLEFGEQRMLHAPWADEDKLNLLRLKKQRKLAKRGMGLEKLAKVTQKIQCLVGALLNVYQRQSMGLG